MLEVSRMLTIARGGRLSTPRAPARYGDQAAVPVVVWNVCRQCNMTCPHCYAAAGLEPSKQRLDTEEGRALLDMLASGGVKHLIFSGGEPLMRDDIFALIEHASTAGLIPHLSTNGVYIDHDVAARLRSLGVAYVGVSIDGLPEFNDHYRGLENAYQRAIDGLLAARDAGIKTGVRITVTRDNASHVAPMLARAAAHRFDRFYVSHLVWAGRARSIVARDLLPAETRTLVETLFDSADTLEADIEVVTGGNDSVGAALVLWIARRYGPDAAERVASELRARGGNSAGEKILNIDHRGDVHPDQFWRQATLGNVRADSWNAILGHPLRKELAQRTAHLTGRCGACDFVSLCRGSHRERSVALGTGTFGPDPACLLTDDELRAPSPLQRGAA